MFQLIFCLVLSPIAYSPQITEFDVALQTGIDVGDYCVQGRLEIYSCLCLCSRYC